MGFFDSVREGFDRVSKTVKDTYNEGRENQRERRANKNTSMGHTVSQNKDGSYVYTDSKGNRITTSLGPNEAFRSDGFTNTYNPVVQGAADARGVGLYTSKVGGNYLTTPQADARYLSKSGPMDMDYTRRHMNPFEFMSAYGKEMSGGNVNWDKVGFAGAYSPVPEDVRAWQDMNRSFGLSFNGALPSMPQMPTTLPFPMPGYPQYPQFPGGYPTAPNGNGGINPGGMYSGGQMWAGGTPYFNEQTGQYTSPFPQLPQINLQLPQQQNVDWNSLFSMMMPMMMGSMNGGGMGMGGGYGMGGMGMGGFPMMGGGYGYGF